MSNVCPVCKKDDRITKISAIYSGGYSSGSYQGPSTSLSTSLNDGHSYVSGGYSTLTGSSQTMLSRKLAPPPKPVPQKKGGCGFTLVIVFLVSIGFLGLISGMVADDPLYGLITFFVALLLLMIPISIRVSANSKEEDRIEELLPIWENAMRLWQKLYYCQKDDCVFNPETGEYFSVDGLYDYLYRRKS